MNGSVAAVFFGILIVAIGAIWILAGGLADPAELPAVPDSSPLPTAYRETGGESPAPETEQPKEAITLQPDPVVTTATTIPTPTVVPTPVSADMVRDHFLDIAYSPTNRLERLNYTIGQNRLILSVVTPEPSDIIILSHFAREFNAASRSVTISENIKESDKGDIVIKFIPGSGMSSILLDEIPDVGPQHEVLTRREMTSGGVTSCKVVRGTVYINGNLKGDERNHTVARCLWYELGVTGETAHYPDSLFSASTNTNTQLSEIDRKAVAILYEPALANSMSVEDLRKVIYLP